MLAGSPLRNLVILPLNVAAVMPPELLAASPAVWAELEVYLRAQGKELKTVSFRDARRLWIESIREARKVDAHAGYEDASRLLVGKLATHASFDAVIAPSLYLREARIAERSAKWDGVERPIEVEAPGKLPAGVPLEGAAPAASLHVVVLDAQGNQIHEAIGGLELLVAVRVLRKRDIAEQPEAEWQSGTVSLQFVTRTDLFASREQLHEGIALALAPFLPPLPLATNGDAELQ